MTVSDRICEVVHVQLNRLSVLRHQRSHGVGVMPSRTEVARGLTAMAGVLTVFGELAGATALTELRGQLDDQVLHPVSVHHLAWLYAFSTLSVLEMTLNELLKKMLGPARYDFPAPKGKQFRKQQREVIQNQGVLDLQLLVQAITFQPSQKLLRQNLDAKLKPKQCKIDQTALINLNKLRNKLFHGSFQPPHLQELITASAKVLGPPRARHLFAPFLLLTFDDPCFAAGLGLKDEMASTPRYKTILAQINIDITASMMVEALPALKELWGSNLGRPARQSLDTPRETVFRGREEEQEKLLNWLQPTGARVVVQGQ
jgi:hypothetical protein